MKKIKKVIAALSFILPSFFVNAENFKSRIEDLPAFDLNRTNYDLSLINLINYKNFFVPKLTLNIDETISNDFLNESFNNDFSPVFNLMQELCVPLSISLEMETDFIYDKNFDCFSWNFLPELALNVPLSFSDIYIKNYGKIVKNLYKKNKLLSEYELKIANRKALIEYVEVVGNYLLCGELLKAYENKKDLLETQTEDYSSLFLRGKITMVELSKQSADKLSFYKEKVEAEESFINSKVELSKLGVNEEKIIWNLENFIDDWEKFYSVFVNDELFLQEKNFLELDNSYNSSILSSGSELPVFETSFSYNPGYLSAESDSNFENSMWSVGFSLNFKTRSGNGPFIQNRKLKLEKNQYLLKRQKLEREAEFIQKERECKSKTLEVYRESMKKNAELEMQRFQTYSDLLVTGKVSEFDVELQKNTMEIYKISYQKARLTELLNKLGNY